MPSGGLEIIDKNGKACALFQCVTSTDGTNRIQLTTRKPDNSDWGESFTFGTSRDGKAYYGRPQIISTYTSGKSGYIIWSNGYCEQWGAFVNSSKSTTINLSKTYANTNYGGTVSANWSDSVTGQNEGFRINSVSQIAITCSYGSGVTLFWKAWGYLATNQY